MIAIILGYGIVIKSGVLYSVFIQYIGKMCLGCFSARNLVSFSYMMVLYVVLVLWSYIKCICFVVM
jgi:hypothetical protein